MSVDVHFMNPAVTFSWFGKYGENAPAIGDVLSPPWNPELKVVVIEVTKEQNEWRRIIARASVEFPGGLP